MKRLLMTILAVWVIAMAGCTSSPETRGAGKSHQRWAVPANSDHVVIGYLEKRDRVITIKAGPHGALYSVATKEGKVLFENLSAEQLKAKAPEIHDLFETGIARSPGRPDEILDASMRLP
jgi:hypothetical protein